MKLFEAKCFEDGQKPVPKVTLSVDYNGSFSRLLQFIIN